MQRTKSKTQATSPSHPNEEIAHALHSVQDLLAELKLVWHDHGRQPDCQFTSFIHATKKTVPGLDDIMAVRKACKNLLYANPPPLVASLSDWRDSIKAIGFNNSGRKQDDEHTLRALAGAFATRINVIIVTSSGHHTVQYNPPAKTPHREVSYMVDLHESGTYPSLPVHHKDPERCTLYAYSRSRV